MDLSAPWNEPSRRAGWALLQNFLPRVGDYARLRNFDQPGHTDVSRLSPYVRSRLLSEAEIYRTVREQYSWDQAEKFLQEVVWRTYWKGWLEMRPVVWQEYRKAVGCLRKEGGFSPLDLSKAEKGETGIACFDYWVSELRETGYLHNHARMWFASLWIFTLRLPWALGADFFFRHLLDGDPASNTLGWRWVAGLQTKGKPYLARAENIQKFTGGRFYPKGQLVEDAEPLTEDMTFSRGVLPAGDPWPPEDGRRRGLLLLVEDCSVEETPLGKISLAALAGWSPEAVLEKYGISARPVNFQRGALADALQRAGQCWGKDPEMLQGPCPVAELKKWIEENALDELIVFAPPVGPWQEAWRDLRMGLGSFPVRSLRRPWDDALWPRATAGFFRFKKGIATVLEELVE
ncbi:MAG: hypothetical protein LAT55_09265 [Opitutales bacterium]|nr:hypothetical protein [Opitutales bacterium]